MCKSALFNEDIGNLDEKEFNKNSIAYPCGLAAKFFPREIFKTISYFKSTQMKQESLITKRRKNNNT